LLRSSEPALQLLRALGSACQSRKARLEEELENLREQLRAAYDPLSTRPYELFAIWVHQGHEAKSGHYLAYLKDWRRDRWVRFSDSQVSVVPWELVKAAALGSCEAKANGSSSAAYVLVYMEAALAQAQRFAGDKETIAEESPESVGQPDGNTEGEAKAGASTDELQKASEARAVELMPPRLLRDIHSDNVVLRREAGSWEEQLVQRGLRRHAEAVFQHYAGLMHRWEPQKRIGDAAGNPHDTSGRKQLNDPALMCFDLFLYRLHGEQEVWAYLVAKSLEAQRPVRNWSPEDEGQVLYFLAATLRSQDCYAKMLVEMDPVTEDTGALIREAEMVPMDMVQLSAQYDKVLVTAHILDSALQNMKSAYDKAPKLLPAVLSGERHREASGAAPVQSQLPHSVGLLARLWATWNLEAEYKFRQNEVLLVMSVLIYNTVDVIEKNLKTLPEKRLESLRETCEYFFVLLHCVEWPKSWKAPLQGRIQTLFPKAPQALQNAILPVLQEKARTVLLPAEQKQMVLLQPLSLAEPRSIEDFQNTRPEPSQEFFESHRTLFSWVMQNDEALARHLVLGVRE